MYMYFPKKTYTKLVQVSQINLIIRHAILLLNFSQCDDDYYDGWIQMSINIHARIH